MDIPKEVCSKIEVPRQNIATAKRLLCDSATYPPAGTTTCKQIVIYIGVRFEGITESGFDGL
jgi:hypothetical protein